MPKISVIVPVYKVEDYLRECIDSIINQQYADFEVILVDDGSPDRCPEICDEYAAMDSRIRVVHKKNGGLSSARNAGLPYVNGDYIWFVDSDDYLKDDAFAVVSKYFEEDADIIKFGVLYRKKSGEITKEKLSYIGTADKNKMAELAQNACSTHLFTFVWRSVYRADFIKKNNLSFVDGLSFAEDSAFNSKAFLLSEKTVFADDYPYVYRDRRDGISKNIGEFFDEKIIDHFACYDRIRDESYEKYCVKKSREYYKDAGRFVLLNVFLICIIGRLYPSRNRNKYFLFRKAARSEMMRKALKRFDIKEIKSKSLDWYMFWAVKHRLYFIGHLICRFILFK